MNIRDFYETAILRGFLEYLCPGFLLLVLVSSAIDIQAIVDAQPAIMYPRVMSAMDEYLGWVLPSLILGSYLIGHVLAALSDLIRSTQVFESLPTVKAEQQDDLIMAIQSIAKINERKAQRFVERPDFQDVVRNLMEVNQPELFRTYIFRPSSLSCFCERIGLVFLIVMFVFVPSLTRTWDATGSFSMISLWLCLTSLILSLIFYARFIHLREGVEKNIYQLLLTDYLCQ